MKNDIKNFGYYPSQTSTLFTFWNNDPLFNMGGGSEDEKELVDRSDVEKGYCSTGCQQTKDSLQWSKYRTGKDGSTGHGYLAEDYNAMMDRRTGHIVDKVGVNNAKNGPDRITDGRQIQVKYYKSARETVNAAFDKKTGMYKYKVQNGRPQQLEVPKDQFAEAVERMRSKILGGWVQGVKNPDHASKMVRKGALIYKDASDMAKPGKLKGMYYDAKQNAVVILLSGGISAVLDYNQAVKEGKTKTEAIKTAAKGAVASSVNATAITVASNQASRALTPKVAEEAAKFATDKVASLGVSEGVKRSTGSAVKSLITKAGKSNAVTAAITTAVVSLPVFYHACKGDISKGECAEKVASNAGSVAGGMTGGVAGGQGGAVLGTVIGTLICPGIGTAAGATIGEVVGTIAGGIGGSVVGGSATKGLISTVKSLFGKKH